MKPMIPKRTRRLRARAAAINASDSEFEDYGPEPNMKLSHAFLVVLLLHVIAVGGIYAFNTFKAGKATKLEVAKLTSPAAQPPDPSNQPDSSGSQNPKSEDPKNPPPSGEKPPVVAKTSDAPQSAEKTTGTSSSDVVKSEGHQGLLSSLKAILLRYTGHAATAGAATATLATATAQDATNATAVTEPAAASVDATPAAVATMPTSYVVKSGDSITKISALLGVTILDLEKANALDGKSILQVGETLKVPSKDSTAAAPDVTAQAVTAAPSVPAAADEPAAAPVDTTNMTDYTVVKGDNPYKIAKKFKISTDELMKANNITDPKKIQIGQKLKIPPSTRTSKKAVK